MNRRNWAIVINIYLFLSTLVITIIGVSKGAGEGQVGEAMYGWGYFKAFTVDSNILMGIVGGILAYILIRNSQEAQPLNDRAYTLALVGTTAVSLTMLTVIVFLAPMQALMGNGYFFLFKGDMFFFHLLNPLLAIIMTTCLLQGHRYTDRECAIAVMPTLVYSVVYVIAVLVLKRWSDFYGFTFGGRNYLSPVSMAVMYGVSYGIARLLACINNRKGA